MVNAINTLAGRQVSVADHSAHRATLEQLHESDVLVVTHQAYVNATQSFSNARNDKWSLLTNWKGGRRLLTIIDEALCNIIEESQVEGDRLSQAIGFIPDELRMAYGREVEALEHLSVALGHHAGVSEGFGGGACMAWYGDGSTTPTYLTALAPTNLTALRAECSGFPMTSTWAKQTRANANASRR